MWAETVDPSDLHNTVWPRAAAVAEVLWTPLDVIYPNGIAAGEFLSYVHLNVHRSYVAFVLLLGDKIKVDPSED